jgi:hypothetical protein
MKRVLTVVLTVVLVLGLAATAYAGVLTLDGKEAGANVKYVNGDHDSSDLYIKVGSLDFTDGTFVFHMTDLKVTWKPMSSSYDKGEQADHVTLNLDYGNWYAKTGGDTFEFTLSNDRGNFIPYKGELKPTAKVTNDDPHRTDFLLTGDGKIAGLNVGFNMYECENDVWDMNVTGATTFDSIAVAGFYGSFGAPASGDDGSTDPTLVRYYGGDVAFNNIFAAAKLWAGVYANTGDGLAYRIELSDVQAGIVGLAAGFRVGNENVKQSGSWKDGNVPGADTKELWAKASLSATFFEMVHSLAVEFTRNMIDETNKIKATDGFDVSDVVKSVNLALTIETDKNVLFEASAGIFPVEGLEIWPKLTNEFGVGGTWTAEGAAQYTFDGTVLRGGLLFNNDGLNKYFVFGDSTGTFGALDTGVAGMYLKKAVGTGDESTHTRAFGKATTDISEDITAVGAKALYVKDNDDAWTRVAFGGKYAVSYDTTLSADYVMTAADGTSQGHLFLELTKKIGSATFKLSYGDGVGYEGKDDGVCDKPSWKEWITKGNVPWRELFGPKDPIQNTIKAGVTIPF